MAAVSVPRKRSSRKGVGGRPKTPNPMVPISSFKGSPAFKDWFEEYLVFARLPAATAIEHAIIDHAAKLGFEKKPPTR